MRICQLLAGLGDLLYPLQCSICSKLLGYQHQSVICEQCYKDIVWISSPLCRRCGKAFTKKSGGDSLCGVCLQKPPAYTLARSVVSYTPPIQKLVQGLKYSKDLSVLAGISELIHQFHLTEYRGIDYILPVPLHFKRLQQRGWNQATILSKLFFPQAKQRVLLNLLIRKENTAAQTRLSGVQRRRNLHKAFMVQSRIDLSGTVVCLVDDVFTTGTTVEECSKVLMAAGVAKVLVLTFARADLHGGK